MPTHLTDRLASGFVSRARHAARNAPRARGGLGALVLLFVLGLSGVLPAAVPAGHAGPTSVATPVSLPDMDTLVAQTDLGVLVGMASWCGPCKAELPHLVKLHKEYRGKGLAVYGISIDFAGPQAMQSLMNTFGVEFPVYWTGEAGMDRYGLNPIPMLVFIKNGREVLRVQGAHSEEELRVMFEDFVSGRLP